MATKNVTVIFDRKGKVLKNGSGEVEIRIYLSRNQRKYIKVCTTTSKGWKFYQKSKELKEVCEKYEEIVRTMKLSGEELTIDNLNFHIDVEAVRAANEDPLKRSFTDFIKKEIEKETLRHGTYRHKIHVIETLEIFGKIKTIGDLTVANIREFDRWLHDTGDRSDVTIWDYHKRVKKYTRLLKMNEVIEKDPYEICKFSHGRSKTRTPLSEPELIALRRIRLDDKYDRVRDLFIFAAYTGLSYVDVENFDFDTMTEQIGDMYYKWCKNQDWHKILYSYFETCHGCSKEVQVPITNNHQPESERIPSCHRIKVRHKEKFNLSLLETLYFFFLTENKIFTEFEFATGNDLETSKVSLSVLFCIIEKNA